MKNPITIHGVTFFAQDVEEVLRGSAEEKEACLVVLSSGTYIRFLESHETVTTAIEVFVRGERV